VRRMSKINLQLWFRDAVIAARLDESKAHCHAMRHGSAMRWLYQPSTPGGIYTVSRMLGHSSIATTQRYLHVGPQGRAAMESAVMSDPLTI
jgi:integrase